MNNTKNITQSGIFIALTIIILYLSSILSINTFSLLTAASCIIPICLIRTNLKYSAFVYICSSILSFFLLPLKTSLLYVLFFGIYGLIKSFIERINKLLLEIPIKLFFFNIIFFMTFKLFENIINIHINYPIYILIIFAQFVFLIYDYILTMIISIYINKFKVN